MLYGADATNTAVAYKATGCAERLCAPLWIGPAQTQNQGVTWDPFVAMGRPFVNGTEENAGQLRTFALPGTKRESPYRMQVAQAPQ